MPDFARMILIALASAAASCTIELSQDEAEPKKIGQQLTAAYYSCVRTSFASQLPTMVDRNMAIDQAFMVCQAEEAKLRAFENLNVINAAISTHRDILKEELLRR
jgi:hypothetical protein